MAKGVQTAHVYRIPLIRILQTAALLFSEYICLAILSFPWYVDALCVLVGLD